MPTPLHKIRVANSTDAAAVSKLLEVTYARLFPAFYEESVLVQILPLITRANPLLLNSGTFYVAVAGRGNIVGCGGWSRKQPIIGEQIENQGSIRHFATHPDWLRRGIGRDILLQCIADTRAYKIKRLNCYSALGAEDFYGAYGFSIIEQIEVPINSHVSFPAILMRNDLRF